MADRSKGLMEDRRFIRRVLIVLALGALAGLSWYLRSLLLMLFGAVVVVSLLAELAEHYFA